MDDKFIEGMELARDAADVIKMADDAMMLPVLAIVIEQIARHQNIPLLEMYQMLSSVAADVVKLHGDVV